MNTPQNICGTISRSNDIVTVLTAQDYSQIKKTFSKEEAEAVFNMTGNIISGQVSGETAKFLSERFPKIMQDRQSVSINSNDTSVSKSKQLESSVPPSTISSLSSGEFVVLMSDNPDQPIELKIFHAKIMQDKPLMNEKTDYKALEPTTRLKEKFTLQENLLKVKEEVQLLAEGILQELVSDPAKQHLLIRK